MLAVLAVLAMNSAFLFVGCIAFGAFCDRSGEQLTQLGSELIAGIAILVAQKKP